MKVKLIFLFLLITGFTFAQNPTDKQPKTPEERATQRTSRMEKQLKLNADQKNTVYAANLEAATQTGELRKKAKAKEIDRKTALEQKKTIETSRDAKISGTLDADQKVKYEAMKAKAIQKMKERRGGKLKGKGKGKGKLKQETDDDMEDLEDDSEDF